MTAQPVEANVVLTADNSQYDQAMTQSAGTTSSLGQSVDNLGMKISKLTKTAGKSLIGISAADVALITGATAAWSSYEKQMSLLQAQSAVLTRTQTQQTAVMKDYTTAVKGLRTAYGTTTAEATSLVQTLSKITTIRQSRDLTDLSKVFIDMSHATGESSDGLASSLTNLQRVMGTRIDDKHTRRYADQFTYLAAQTQGSAQQLIDFTAQLAPAGRQIGIHSDAMAGFSAAFMKAGADAGPAATVFTKITTDIARSLQTGSPEIAHYANLIGVTQKAFKDMKGGDQVLAIFEALQAQGKGAANELNRLGLDGPRSIRAIQAVLQGGNLRDLMASAQSGKGTASAGAAAEGADAADTMTRSLDKLNEQTKMFAETMGSYFAPAVEGFVKGLTKAMTVVNDITSGPLGKFLGMILQIVAPFAAGAGAILLFAGALLKVAGAFTLLRSSAAYGVREGLQGGGGMTRLPDGSYVARGRTMLGQRGAQLAEGGTWLQRAQYQAGQPVGAALRSRLGMPMLIDAYRSGREWVDPKYNRPEAPAESRSAMSYVAGGLGRGIQQFVTPTFDQMRFADPTKRMQWLSQTAPWSRVADRMRLAGHMGAEGLAETQLGRVRTEQARVAEEPLMTNAARTARQAELKTIEEETKARLDSSRQQRMASEDVINSYRAQSEEVKSSTVGYSRLREALGLTREGVTTRTGAAFGVAGGVMGAGRAAVGGVLRSPMGMPIAGMAGMGALSAFGVQSNALMMGAGGAMMGPAGAAVGLGVGAAIDIAKANDSAMESIQNLNAAATEATSSGTGLASLDQQAAAAKRSYDSLQVSLNVPQTPTGMVMHPVRYGQFLKNKVESVFGDSDSTEATDALEAAQAKVAQVDSTIRELGKATGTRFTGTNRAQRNQMEAFATGAGAEALARAGVDLQDLVGARKAAIAGGPEAESTYQAMLKRVATGGVTRAEATGTAAGRAMAEDPQAQRSIRFQADVGAFYEGTKNMYADLRKQGLNNVEIMHSAALQQHKIGDENARQSELQVALMGKAQQNIAAQLPMMTQAQRFQTGIGQLGALTSIPTKGMSSEALGRLETQKGAATELIQSQVGAIQQALLMQDQFEISRARAQEDFALQRGYSEHDYQLQRARAEDAFDRGRRRSQAEYDRSVRRANFEFNLQRSQQENDYHHQVEVQAKQMAQNVYDVYARIQVERTSSAQWVLANAQQQIVTMQQQEKNLDILRGRGFTNNAIQQFRLTDPNQAQELARLTTEVTTKAQVKAFNEAAQQRLKAGRGLMTDPSSLEFGEMERAQRIGLRRSMDNFQRAQRQGHNDFERGLHQQRVDFNIMMDQQAEDYATMMNRQEHQYHLTMNRAAEDLANYGKEMSGSIHDILTKGTEELTGNMQKQAAAALRTFDNLKKSTSPVAISIMKELSSIFGFEYKVPKGVGPSSAAKSHAHDQGPTGPSGPSYDGGILPGWTPGRDVHTATVSGGEAIMRPEWARAVGAGAIDAMNHKAKYGGFAEGGVVNPDRRVYMDGEPISKITKAQLLLAERLSHTNMTTMQGSWQPYTSYSGSSHMGPGVVDESPGNFQTQYWLRRVGFAAWGRNFPGAATAGSGAHVHAVSLLDPGAAGQSQIAAFYAGQDGLGGRDYGPDPGMLPGLMGMLAQFGALALAGGGPGGRPPTAVPRLSEILKHRYQGPEAAAWGMQGVHPLNPGDISHVMNKMVRARYAESLEGVDPNKKHTTWHGEGGLFHGPQHIGVAESGPEAVIPLNDQGAAFLAKAMIGAEARGVGMGSSPMRGGMSVYNTRIDKSTNFSGPITVQANDPAELIHKLQARQRVMALSRPSLTGSAA